MIRRIVVHTGDLHFGKNRKFSDYLEQQRYVAEAIIASLHEVLKRESRDTSIWFILAGDIFDLNEDTNRDEYNLFFAGILLPLMSFERQYANFKYFIIDGNHDRQPFVDQPSVLSPFTAICPTLAVVTPRHFPEDSLLLVPFGKYKDAQFAQLLKQYPSQFVVAHECLARMTTDFGWTPPRDQDHYLEIDNVMNEDVAGIFLADIHKMQSLDRRRLAWYSGSPVTLDYGHTPPKGILIHYFRQHAEGVWRQDREPELKPLEDNRIRTHLRLGVVTNPNKIPVDVINNAHRYYLNMKVSPDVYQQIDKISDSFFRSDFVDWGFHEKNEARSIDAEVVAEEAPPIVEVGYDYYRPLINHWFEEYGYHLLPQEKDLCFEKLRKDFQNR